MGTLSLESVAVTGTISDIALPIAQAGNLQDMRIFRFLLIITPAGRFKAVAEVDFSVSEMLTMAAAVLGSKTACREKSASSIKTFREAVRAGNVAGLREELATMKTEMRELKQLLLSLGAVLPEKKGLIANF